MTLPKWRVAVGEFVKKHKFCCIDKQREGAKHIHLQSCNTIYGDECAN
jgi:hypothetical protein